jgi:hypothetical protein
MLNRLATLLTSAFVAALSAIPASAQKLRFEAIDSTAFSGVVVDSMRKPVVGAEVSVPNAGKTTITDSLGTFHIPGIPVGEQIVTVRRLGFARLETNVVFEAGKSAEIRLVLGRAILLEAVEVKANGFERAMRSFDEHQRVGLGRFMTRSEISKYDGMKLASVLQQLPNAAVDRGQWITSNRAPSALCAMPGPPRTSTGILTALGHCLENHGYYVPEPHETLQGMQVKCYPLVYIDNVLVTGHKEPTEPFDVNEIAPERVEAIEFYAGAAQTPLEYSRMGSNCGVLVIWTRRR